MVNRSIFGEQTVEMVIELKLSVLLTLLFFIILGFVSENLQINASHVSMRSRMSSSSSYVYLCNSDENQSKS
jgi:hypothetical protein